MPKNHSHLTTEQFSAFLDQHLSAQEQSLCQAHLIICDSCQQQLAELQQTVLLVRALPRAPLPRSFVLPIDTTIQNTVVAEQDASTPQRARLAHNRLLILPRSVRTIMRVASTLVAVLGLFFISTGLLSIVSPNAETSQVATPFVISKKVRIPSSYPNTNQVQVLSGSIASPSNAPQFQGSGGRTTSSPNFSPPQSSTGIAIPASNASQSKLPAGPANAQTTGSLPSTSQPPQLISFFDLGTPEGHLSLGLLLFIVGMVSVLVFARLGKQAWEDERQR